MTSSARREVPLLVNSAQGEPGVADNERTAGPISAPRPAALQLFKILIYTKCNNLKSGDTALFNWILNSSFLAITCIVLESWSAIENNSSTLEMLIPKADTA